MGRRSVSIKTLRTAALSIIDYLAHDGLWNYVQIYVDGKKYEANQTNNEAEPHITRFHIMYYVDECAAPQVTASNIQNSLILVSSNGPLSYKLSDSTESVRYLYEMTEKILHKHGLYIEKLDAHTLSVKRCYT